MNWFFGSTIEKMLTSRFSVLVSLAFIIFFSCTVISMAADGPSTTNARASQGDSLEIPGSFKELPEALDGVTAKRSPERIESIAPGDPAAMQFTLDTDKVARTDFDDKNARVEIPAYGDAELLDFHATAYCLKGRTASGINTRPGVIAADPRILPLGTVVHLRAGRYTGTYTVMDTGGLIKGRLVDVYVETHREAIQFGRQKVKIKVIGRGSPKSDRSNKGVLASGL